MEEGAEGVYWEGVETVWREATQEFPWPGDLDRERNTSQAAPRGLSEWVHRTAPYFPICQPWEAREGAEEWRWPRERMRQLICALHGNWEAVFPGSKSSWFIWVYS